MIVTAIRVGARVGGRCSVGKEQEITMPGNAEATISFSDLAVDGRRSPLDTVCDLKKSPPKVASGANRGQPHQGLRFVAEAKLNRETRSEGCGPGPIARRPAVALG